MLLERLADVRSGHATERLAVVGGWLPDPRIDAALVGLLESPPYRSASTRPFWRQLLSLLRRIRDPAQLPRLEALPMAGWLRAERDQLVGVLAATLSAPPPAEPPLLDQLAAELDGRRIAGVEALLQGVYEAPDDDARRLVLADALLERDDPRGELISVQIRLHHDPSDRALGRRAEELICAHGRAWLGELAPALADFRFERGFLAACTIDVRELARVPPLVGRPAWSTVHTLAGSAAIALHAGTRSLRTLTFSRADAALHEGMPTAWRDLLADTERPLEDLRYEDLHDEIEGELRALRACSALPRLRRLTIAGTPALYLDEVARAPVLDRLERLGFSMERAPLWDVPDGSPLVPFEELLRDARVPTLAFDLGSPRDGTELELVRGPSGYERARITLGGTFGSTWSTQLVDEALRILGALPRTVRQLRVTARRGLEEAELARLLAAAAELDLAPSGARAPSGAG
jgi:uncharacterized protein (TIGR02996 family)